MRFLKRMACTIGLLVAIGWMFRGWLYTHLLTYRSVGVRAAVYATSHRDLIAYLDSGAKNADKMAIEDLIRRALSLTSEKLHFADNQTDIDPNKLIHSGKAHCVGYAAFFATTCNYLLKKQGLADTWEAKPQIGQLYCLGINVHPYFHSPFFKDHDFVTIENKNSKQIWAVDPTVHDYLGVDFVHFAQ